MTSLFSSGTIPIWLLMTLVLLWALDRVFGILEKIKTLKDHTSKPPAQGPHNNTEPEPEPNRSRFEAHGRIQLASDQDEWKTMERRVRLLKDPEDRFNVRK